MADEMTMRVALWNEINAYAESCGGTPAAHVYGNTRRMNAVAAVERVVREHTAAAVERACPTTRSQPTGGDDFDEVCDGCDEIVAEPHTWAECAKGLRERRDHFSGLAYENEPGAVEARVAAAVERERERIRDVLSDMARAERHGTPEARALMSAVKALHVDSRPPRAGAETTNATREARPRCTTCGDSGWSIDDESNRRRCSCAAAGRGEVERG